MDCITTVNLGSGEDKTPECWICYDGDRDDVGAMIYPCNCKGDVSAVHHDCLRRWLVEVVRKYLSLNKKSHQMFF